jgi:hypothetical protein
MRALSLNKKLIAGQMITLMHQAITSYDTFNTSRHLRASGYVYTVGTAKREEGAEFWTQALNELIKI